jgi:hypothetical protein
MLDSILGFTINEIPVGAMVLFLGPIIGFIVLVVLIKLYLHRKYMQNWFAFAIAHELSYEAPKGSLQKYFDLTDKKLAQRHKPVPPLIALNEYVGTIKGTVSDDFQVEMTVVKSGCIQNYRSNKPALRYLSDAAMQVLPEDLFKSQEQGSSSSGNVYSLIRISIPELPAWLVRSQNLLHSLGSRTGLLQDIQTGDREFDKAILLQGQDESDILAYLTDKRRFSIQRVFKELEAPGGIFLLEAHGLFYCRKGIITKSETLEKVYQQLLDLAKLLYYLRD